jgi:hypothetical protein
VGCEQTIYPAGTPTLARSAKAPATRVIGYRLIPRRGGFHRGPAQPGHSECPLRLLGFLRGVDPGRQPSGPLAHLPDDLPKNAEARTRLDLPLPSALLGDPPRPGGGRRLDRGVRPSESMRNEQESHRKAESLSRLQADLEEAHLESVKEARQNAPPLIVRSCRTRSGECRPSSVRRTRRPSRKCGRSQTRGGGSTRPPRPDREDAPLQRCRLRGGRGAA